jgi:hypothetical protein
MHSRLYAIESTSLLIRTTIHSTIDARYLRAPLRYDTITPRALRAIIPTRYPEAIRDENTRFARLEPAGVQETEIQKFRECNYFRSHGHANCTAFEG